MVQVPPTEKLHAACDECRSRKLKCSGDAPKCVRCERERVDCVYSPQKPMGRPRKRRREGEADVTPDMPADDSNGYVNSIGSFSITPDAFNSGQTSPPQQFDHPRSSISSVNGVPILGPDRTFDVGFPGVDSFPELPLQNYDASIDPAIDPSLWAVSDSNDLVNSSKEATGTCSCLSVQYLTQSELQSIQNFAFPQIIIPLRKAMVTVSDIINCPYCPKDGYTAQQNVSSLSALFKAILERFNKAINWIDAEAKRLEETGEKKPYRIGDNNPSLHHLHTGTLDCPMGFNIELEAQDWKRLVKNALKTEIYGGGSNPLPLMDLIQEAESRQQRWHDAISLMTPEQRQQIFAPTHMPEGPVACESLNAKHLVFFASNLNWK